MENPTEQPQSERPQMQAHIQAQTQPQSQEERLEQPFNSRYATRERIVRQYAAQDAQRARNARIYSQETAESYKQSAARAKERARQREILDAQRREEEAMKAAQRAAQRESDAAYARMRANAREHTNRTAVPLSSQESRDRARISQESYERARAMRDALSIEHQNRSPNRELIDARGSVDSRAFSEHDQLVGYSINRADCPDPYVESGGNRHNTHWHSNDGEGRGSARFSNNPGIGSLPSMRGKKLYASSNNHLFRNNSRSSIPAFVKIAVPVIIVLAVILFLILR